MAGCGSYITVGVPYQADLGAALAAVRDVLQASPLTLKDPAPLVSVARLADSSVRVGVRPWVSAPDYGGATSEINFAVLEAFRQRNIAVPVPQLEVRMLEESA